MVVWEQSNQLKMYYPEHKTVVVVVVFVALLARVVAVTLQGPMVVVVTVVGPETVVTVLEQGVASTAAARGDGPVAKYSISALEAIFVYPAEMCWSNGHEAECPIRWRHIGHSRGVHGKSIAPRPARTDSHRDVIV